MGALVCGVHTLRGCTSPRSARRYRLFFVNLMMTEELSLPLPDDVEPSVMGSCAMFGGFVSFGRSTAPERVVCVAPVSLECPDADRARHLSPA